MIAFFKELKLELNYSELDGNILLDESFEIYFDMGYFIVIFNPIKSNSKWFKFKF